jgi:hypothetical protein
MAAARLFVQLLRQGALNRCGGKAGPVKVTDHCCETRQMRR